MADCEFLETCPIFDRFHLEGLKNLWIRLYCMGKKQEVCERKKLRREGNKIPITLLPNGKHLGTELEEIADCEFLETCPIFEKFKLEGLKNLWIRLYCKGKKQEVCERKKLKREGNKIPITLLPNGKHLGSVK